MNNSDTVTDDINELPFGQPHEHVSKPSRLLIPTAFILIFALASYGYLLYQGTPQQWTERSNAALKKTEYDTLKQPPIIMVVPFVGLLLCIAFLPLIPAIAHWWERNTSKLLIATGLGALTLLYYYFGCDFPVERHWPAHDIIDPAIQGGYAVARTVLINAIMYEYIPFIVLLFSLFVITGGIRIGGNLKATPFVNTIILSIGTILASFIGTTGAAMLLIRLLLETNRMRKYKVHTVVVFIFCVCNCGGCLTPLGDPPLFLGYLRGITFEWTFFALWSAWLFVNMTLLFFYFLWDTTWFYRRESNEYTQNNTTAGKMTLAISGWMLNVPLLLGVVAAVAFLAPNKPISGWYPPYYLREAIQLGFAAASLLFGSYTIRKENVFNFLAIGEVAALFFGIFICMQAPLQILSVEGRNIVAYAEEQTGFRKETLFFWTAGPLGLFLDNAPTYVVFFETARSLSLGINEDEARNAWHANEKREFKPVPVGKHGFIDHYLLLAVALGTVFMGGMTYIANGPNFMVKAIAEHSGVNMPSFFGYMVYSFLILLPVIIVASFIFV